MKNSKFKIQNLLKAFCIFNFAFLISCVTGSIPNLDEPECAESRDVVKKFYSYHFDKNMLFSQESLKEREKFLTPEFFKFLQKLKNENDVFTTNSTDVPRTFKLGDCKVIEPTKTEVEVLLFWKDSSRSEQKSIRAEVVKQRDKWLINKVLF